MATRKTYVLECPESCSLRAGSKVGIKVTEWMLEGRRYREIVAAVKAEDDYKLFPSTMTRHKRHIVVTGLEKVGDPVSLYKANNIEILETIIQKGFHNSKNWKPTISDTMKAMDMWFRLTQGNPFDDLLNTLASASIGEDDEPDTEDEVNPVAVADLDEVQMAESIEEDLEAVATSAGT